MQDLCHMERPSKSGKQSKCKEKSIIEVWLAVKKKWYFSEFCDVCDVFIFSGF